MRFLAKPYMIRFRNLARALGLTKLVTMVTDGRARAMRRARASYRRERPEAAHFKLGAGEILLAANNEEEYVQALALSREQPLVEALRSHLAEGDCFWDVGANVGAYSCALGRFLEECSGQVVAFEPDPWCHERLGVNLGLNRMTRASTHRLALSDTEGVAGFARDRQGTTTGHLVSRGRAEGEDLIEVATTSGDRVIEQGLAEPPAVIKIDTEGYETQVLAGLRRTLRDPGCRFVLVEVHFSVLRKRGLVDAPGHIESMLRDAGFSGLEWLDFSHLAASKNRAAGKLPSILSSASRRPPPERP